MRSSATGAVGLVLLGFWLGMAWNLLLPTRPPPADPRCRSAEAAPGATRLPPAPGADAAADIPTGGGRP